MRFLAHLVYRLFGYFDGLVYLQNNDLPLNEGIKGLIWPNNVVSVFSSSIFLEFPLSVVEGTDLSGLEPARNAMQMKCVVADSPSDGAVL